MFSKIIGISIAGSLLLGGGFFFLSSGKTVSFLNRQENFSDVPQEESSSSVKNTSPPLVLLFGGDVMFDRYLRTVARRKTGRFLFEQLLPTFQDADVVVANLEGPITENPSQSEASLAGEAKNYVFTFDPSVALLLKQTHIDVVNIGNNHILNFKEDGVRETKKYLKQAQVDFFGSPLAGDDRMLREEIKGVKIVFVNYNQFVWHGEEKAFEDITIAKGEADVVILYAHWGTEYVEALPKTKELAHEFIDTGVDLIIGSHPHVVQEKEVYHGKMIYYSLGNLIFDQYTDEGTKHGLLVKTTIDPETKKLSFEDIPVTLENNGQTILTDQ